MTKLATPLVQSRRIPGYIGPAIAIAATLALGAVWTFSRTTDVWRSGAYFDSDDALRMVQLRDLIAGQGWYDMTVARMDPPAGVFMHWSRTIDLPLAALMKLFGAFSDQPTAEALTRLTFPFLLLAALYAAVAWIARQFGDELEQIAAIALAFLSGSVFAQFIPGRIDHHAPQIVLLALMTGASLAALDSSRAKFAGLSGALAALSLSISVENLPFIALLAALQPIGWVLHGSERRRALIFYAAGLATALVVCFLATIGPQRWSTVACDAYSIAHALPGLAGAAVLLALAGLTPRLGSRVSRAAALVVLAPAPLIVMKLFAPGCIGDPYVGLDPLVRTVWLDHVLEVQTLLELARNQPGAALTLVLPIAASLLATIACAFASTGVRRERLMQLAMLIVAGLAMTFWAVRVYSFVAPLAAAGGGVAAASLARRFTQPGLARAALMALACFPCAAATWAIFIPDDAAGGETTGTASAACLTPRAMRALDALPPGVVLAPINLGSHLLVHTRHSVTAAPYHRNNHGDRIAIEAFFASPEEAERIVRAAGVDYVLVCADALHGRPDGAKDPADLGSMLAAGQAPGWLAPIELGAAPNRVFRIRQPG